MKFQEDMAICKQLLLLAMVLCFKDDTCFPDNKSDIMRYNKLLSSWALPRACTRPGVQCELPMSPCTKGTPWRRECWVNLVKIARRNSAFEGYGFRGQDPWPFPMDSRWEGFLPLSSNRRWLLTPTKPSRGRPGRLENNDNQPVYPTGSLYSFRNMVQGGHQIIPWMQGMGTHARELFPTIFKTPHPPNHILCHNEWKQEDYSIWKVTDVTAVENNCFSLSLFFLNRAGEHSFCNPHCTTFQQGLFQKEKWTSFPELAL